MPVRIQHILERFIHHKTKSARSIFKDSSRTARVKSTCMKGTTAIVLAPGSRLAVIANTECGLTPGWYTIVPTTQPLSIIDCWSTPGNASYNNIYSDPFYTVNPSRHRAYGFNGALTQTDWFPLVGPADPLQNASSVQPAHYGFREVFISGVGSSKVGLPTLWGQAASYGRPTTGTITLDVKCVSLGSAQVYTMGADTNPQYFGPCLPNGGVASADVNGASYAPMSNVVLSPPSSDIMDPQQGVPAKGAVNQVIGDSDPLKVTMRVTDSRLVDSARIGNSGFFPMMVADGGSADWFLPAATAVPNGGGFKTYSVWSDTVVDGTVSPNIITRQSPVFAATNNAGVLDPIYAAMTPPLYGGVLDNTRFPDAEACGPSNDLSNTDTVIGPFQNAISKSAWASATQAITIVENPATSGYPVYVTMSFDHSLEVGVRPSDPQFAISDPAPTYSNPYPPNFSGFLGVGGAGIYQNSLAKSIVATGSMLGLPANITQSAARLELATQMLPGQFASLAQHIMPQLPSVFNPDALAPAKSLLDSAKEALTGIGNRVIENVQKDPEKALDVVTRMLGKFTGSGVEEEGGDLLGDAMSFF